MQARSLSGWRPCRLSCLAAGNRVASLAARRWISYPLCLRIPRARIRTSFMLRSAEVTLVILQYEAACSEQYHRGREAAESHGSNCEEEAWGTRPGGTMRANRVSGSLSVTITLKLSHPTSTILLQRTLWAGARRFWTGSPLSSPSVGSASLSWYIERRTDEVRFRHSGWRLEFLDRSSRNWPWNQSNDGGKP